MVSNLPDFIRKSCLVHADRYDYSLAEYVNDATKLKILCQSHGIFEQRPNHHLRGIGCPKCGVTRRPQNLGKTKERFIAAAMKIHGPVYGYEQAVYVNGKTPVTISCMQHGEFSQRPDHHLSGSGCPKCGIDAAKKLKLITQDEFINRAIDTHGVRYDYRLVKYQRKDLKVDILCKLHGTFSQTPHNHVAGKQGCPKCKASKGEIAVARFLDAHGIQYEQQKAFDGCVDVRQLWFDFYLPETNMCIEFDGALHFEAHDHFGGQSKLEDAQRKDSIKNAYCAANGISLVRLTRISDVETKLGHLFESGSKRSHRSTSAAA